MTFAVIAVVDERIECFCETICIGDIDESDSVSSNFTDRANIACDDGEASVLSLRMGNEALIERGYAIARACASSKPWYLRRPGRAYESLFIAG